MKPEITKLCPDFYDWPNRWQGVPEDIEYGKQIIAIFEPFICSLISECWTSKTIKTHTDNLWLIGGELIWLLNQDQDDKEPLELLMEHIDHNGRMYCRHIQTGPEMELFYSTCCKLYEYLNHE